jgi:hypothetical protein
MKNLVVVCRGAIHHDSNKTNLNFGLLVTQVSCITLYALSFPFVTDSLMSVRLAYAVTVISMLGGFDTTNAHLEPEQDHHYSGEKGQ